VTRTSVRGRIAGGLWAAAWGITLSACAGTLPAIVDYEDRWGDGSGAARRGRLELRWVRRLTTELEGPFMPIERAVAALDPAGDRIYVGSSLGDLWAFDGRGAQIWLYHTSSGIGSPPLLDTERDELFVAIDDGRLHALRASTGEVRWLAEVGGAVGRAPVATDDAIYVITDADVLAAYDRATGEALWRYRREAPEGFYVTEHAGILLLPNHRLVTGFSDGVALCLDARDGSILWTRDTLAELPAPAPGSSLRFTDVDTTPLLAHGGLYIASFAGGLYRLEPGNGSVIWHREELVGVTGIVEGPAGTLILSSGDIGVVGVEARTGETLWSAPMTRGAPTPAVVVGDVVLVGETEGGFVALSAANGRELDRIEDAHGFAAQPAVSMGRGAVLSNTGRLFVFDVR
jgi:outer membrane protein assembly factor BamB